MNSQLDRFGVEWDARGDVPVLHVHGHVDLRHSRLLRAALEQPTAIGSRRIGVDLEDVELLDSSGVKVLVEVHERLRATRRFLCVVAASPAARRILTVLGLDFLMASESWMAGSGPVTCCGCTN